MTRVAVNAPHREVLRMIEFHAKTNQSIWKWFDGARLPVGMTNRADRTLSVLELLGMTSGAGQML